jgi:L-asparaginase II
MPAEILANAIRGETVESVYCGHLCVIDGEGKQIASLGDPTTVTYFRSAAKPFQAIPFITSGAAEAFDFAEEEVALACASHSGEPQHLRVVGQMLDKIGLSADDLRCGAHAPFNETESHRLVRAGYKPTQLHNNCSGKHTAMLGFAKHIGADIATYDSIDNRIQKRILKCIADFTEVPEGEIAIGIDGCAAPNFALPVAAMARSFMNLISPTRFPEPTQAACKRIVTVMMNHPELIGGTERLDTMLMQAAPGKIISKVGADGVWLCGVLPCERYPTGAAIALKIADGDDYRARPVLAAEVLRQLGILSKDDLTDLSPMPIKNRRGEVVGRVEARISL